MGAPSDTFDPYWQWLGIAPEHQPPDYYRLLGLSLFESDVDKVSAAAERTAELVKEKAEDQHADEMGRLLKSIAEAHRCLTDPRRKAAYDRTMKQQGGTADVASRGSPPLPKPKMLDLPPFIPPSPPLEPGPPPVEGEPPPPPVPGEPASHLPPARRAGKTLSPSRPPPITSTESAPPADTTTPLPPPIPGSPVDDAGPPPVMGEPPTVVGSPPAANGNQPPVMGQPPTVMGRPPTPPKVAGERRRIHDESAPPAKSTAPPVQKAEGVPSPAPAPPQTPQAAPPEPKIVPGEPAPAKTAEMDTQPETAASPTPAARPIPLPRKKQGSGAPAASEPNTPEPVVEAPPVTATRPGDRADAARPKREDRAEPPAAPSSPADVAAKEPSPKSRTGVSPAALKKALSPLPAAAGNRGSSSRTPKEIQTDDTRSDESAGRKRGLPWPIILPAGGVIVALLVGLCVLLGDKAESDPQAAQGPGTGDAATHGRHADDEGDIEVDRDDEGSLDDGDDTGGTSDDDTSSDGPSPDNGAEAGDESATDPGDTAEGTGDDAASDAGTSDESAVEPDSGEGNPPANTDTAVAAAGGGDRAAPEDQPPPPEPPPPPPPNPFKQFPKQFAFSAALESAAQAAKEHPLDEAAGWVRVAKLPLAEGQQLSMQLLGGEGAIPGEDSFVLSREFAIDAGVRWRVDVKQWPDVTFPAGWFLVDDGQLTFQPYEHRPEAAAEHLQNCLLQLDVKGASHVLTLRLPQPAAPFPLQLHLNEFQESIPIAGLPDPEVIRLQVVKLVGTSQAIRLPPDPSALVGNAVVIDLLDRHRNAPAAIRVICEDARTTRVRFRITPMARTAGRNAATMGIQAATSEVSRLQKDKAALTSRLKAMDASIKALGGHNRQAASQIANAKKPIQTRIRAIDTRVGQLNGVMALLKPLHQKASIQLRVLMQVEGHEVVLAGPP